MEYFIDSMEQIISTKGFFSSSMGECAESKNGIFPDTRKIKTIFIGNTKEESLETYDLLKKAQLQMNLDIVWDISEGIKKLTSQNYDLIVLDDRIQGVLTLGVIRTNNITIPVIALTDNRFPEKAIELIRAGATECIARENLDSQKMTSCINSVLRIYRAEKRAAVAEERLRLATKAIDSALEAIVITDDKGVIQNVNPMFCSMTGYRPVEVIGQNICIMKSSYHDQKLFDGIIEEIMNRGFWTGELWNQRKNGDIYPEWLSISAIKDERGRITNLMLISKDITERKLIEKRMNFFLYNDSLTGLPNRLMLFELLKNALAQAEQNKSIVAVLFVDLDKFKTVNDTLGHSAGDELLKLTGQRLRESIGAVNRLARFGGDEFVIILEDIIKKRDVTQIAEKIVNDFLEPFYVDNKEITVDTSIGISLYPFDGQDIDVLVRNADIAMYRAKEKGDNKFQFYSPIKRKRPFDQLAIEAGLRKAIDKGELLLHYQPQVDLQTGKIVGAEALIRWLNPETGLVYPNQFIMPIEQTGLAANIGEWVLTNACIQNKAWQDGGVNPIRIAVNMSARQIQNPKFTKMVINALRNTGLDPKYLELEITESVAAQDLGAFYSALNNLKKIGLQISIDDFGMGWSDLNYLKHFPIDTIKIDRSFISDVAVNKNDNVIVSSLIKMAHSLDIRVIAEGVETEDQLAFLRSCSCDGIQGYLVSRPLTGSQFKKLVSATGAELYSKKNINRVQNAVSNEKVVS